ncbi:MAG: Endo,4-beta-xylanase [Bacteroidetes bacterium]|nr:Endo,4-beta-xylanase [Bacteroidota bacterium]
MHKFLIALVLLISFSFKSKHQPTCDEMKLFEKASFPVGAAINTDKLKNDEKYGKIVLSQFNSITPEKIMKAQYIHPKKEYFYFTETDHLIAFCKQNKIRLHGHTLVWHKALPVWLENFKGDKNEWEALLKDHIKTIISHCKGYIKSWDVVNEAFNDDGSLRNNIWLKNIGESYIEKAFLFAAEADPTAKFFYNDFSLESNGKKLNAVLAYITNLKSKGIKIDGIGMQMHVSPDYPYLSDINQAAMAMQEAGLLVHYSELDITLSGRHYFFASRSKMLNMQKDRIKSIVEGYMKLNPENRFGITMWGVTDNDSWLTEGNFRARPLLFDLSYKIKPAYCGFIEALENK